ARMLNLEAFPPLTAVVNVTSPALYEKELLPLITKGHDEGCYVTFAAVDLLQHGEELPDLLPLLGSFAERGILLGCGMIDHQPARRSQVRSAEATTDSAFIIFKTDIPWEPSGSFSRLPAMRVASLYDPSVDHADGEGWVPRIPRLSSDIVSAALAGQTVEEQAATSTALVPVGETGVATVDERVADDAAGQSTPTQTKRIRLRRTTIGFKLISITSIILIVSLTAMILVASRFFRDDVTVRIEDNNHTLAQVTALAVQREFEGIVSNTRLFLTMVSRFAEVPGASVALQTAFFSQQTEIGYVGIPGQAGFYNDSLLEGRQLRHSDLDSAVAAQQAALKAATSGVTSVVNLSPSIGTPMLAIVLPFRQGLSQVPLVIVSALDPFVQAVQTSGITQTYVVNAQGQLVIDPDMTLLAGNIDYSKQPIVAAMLKSPIDNGELQYRNSQGVSYLGSFKRTPFASLGVVAAAPASLAFESVHAIQRRNLYLEVVVLALAILVIYWFSKTITRPVRRLVEAARQVEGGNFLLELRPTTRDELGVLTNTFVQMGRGLHERERIKEAFGKFVSKSMAEQVLQEDVRLGGERRAATIFFSDIRSFTAISEQLQPEEVVEFLNDYMTRMVECVNETGGVVDKFIGDAIMAVWGVPVSRGNDAENAITGALMMRTALQEFNRGRGSSSRPFIRIGCGINSGPVVAGQIGSTERMEYTVIGDPVNLASRIEALNKPFGTDILISSDTYDLVKDLFEVVPQLKIKVKGKSEPQQIYAVLGRKDDLHRPRTLRELQRLIGVDPASLKKQKKVEEEVKYEILEE
ncbi:MAG TPA: adenylate/guanylate cyclase domain-containing protein, partial [Spirochaetia bacterium]|nr:adenylate/guanylate cyclase domain-containing protein [Spirochaetia bacterium]